MNLEFCFGYIKGSLFDNEYPNKFIQIIWWNEHYIVTFGFIIGISFSLYIKPSIDKYLKGSYKKVKYLAWILIMLLPV